MDLKHATIQPQPYKSPPFSLEIPDYPSIPGETIPRRHPLCIHNLKSRPLLHIRTLYDILLHSAENFRYLPTAGTRKHIEIHVEVRKVKEVVGGVEVEREKKWTFFEMGAFEYVSFGRYFERAMGVGGGFRGLGLGRGDRVHIFAATSAHWLLVSHAAVTQSLPIVTSYATLGEEGLTTSLTQTHAKAIFVDAELLPKLLKPLESAKDVRFIIYNDETEVKQCDIDQLKKSHDYLKIISLEELEQLGVDSPVDAVPPKPEDLSCIMYTSGSTGSPKGVPLKHKNIVAAIAGIDTVVSPYISNSDSVLSYLPLAHSFEYAFENACFYWGLKTGYGSPRTLSSLSMKNCEGDIKTFAPSILVGVPAVWETLRKGIEAKVAKEGLVKRGVFWGGLWVKERLCGWGLPGAGVVDRIVFDAVKKETGGQLRACFNGAGPVGRETRRFISFVLVPLISGYGLTETTAMGALMDPFEWTDDTLGAMPGCIEIKLIDYSEAGYFASNTPPQGEILIRGDPVMEGYYESPEETEKAITKDGWFRTGDIGEWAENGHLRIIDRKKNLVKTLNGEYIALEKLESIYRSSNLVANICVFAASDRARPVAIVVPASNTIAKLASERSVENDSLENLVRNKLLKAEVLKELQTTGRKAELASFEILEGVVITDVEWTVQNGLLTVAQKLNRRAIVKLYERDLNCAYGKTKSVI